VRSRPSRSLADRELIRDLTNGEELQAARHTSRLRTTPSVQVFDTLGWVTQVPRRVNLSPRSLTAEQLAAVPTVPEEPVPVQAWVIWEDGVEELVRGHAVAGTPRATDGGNSIS
jgi:hypothetical protein